MELGRNRGNDNWLIRYEQADVAETPIVPNDPNPTNLAETQPPDEGQLIDLAEANCRASGPEGGNSIDRSSCSTVVAVVVVVCTDSE
ncbi:hypothetical protein ANCCAN_07180 [Ancylostoma caninum]|uniref:Uncharacterized protein n=1 Tax=Ancylostoma caninum TaxID=29170 RepID=A0A368GSZ9_ANCCA|nr:hypothetical protein ANCCAN_07180 [Ancylostoma caninum]